MANDQNDAIVIEDGATYRPETIATMLGVSGKLVRGYLRATFTRPIEAKGTTWVLTSDQAQETVAHFIARRAASQAK